MRLIPLLLALLILIPFHSSFLFFRRPWTITNLKYTKSNSGFNRLPFSSARHSLANDVVAVTDFNEQNLEGGGTVAIASNITNKKSTGQRKSLASSRAKFTASVQPDFTIVGMKGVQLYYGDTPILKDATFTAATGERVGLVGANGCGKNILLKYILLKS